MMWRRLSPRTRRWDRLNQFDDRVADLEREHADVQRRLEDLHERHRAAPQRDADKLSEWRLAGSKGPRPQPEEDSLAEALRAAERERDALATAIDQVLDEKARHVEKHRSKFAGDAAKETEEAAARYLEAIEAVERTRGGLVDARMVELWTLTYPHETASRQPEFMSSLARNLVQRLRRAGVTVAPSITELGRLLREDVEALREAVHPDQRARIAGTELERHAPGTMWDESAEGQAAKQHAWREAQEREAAALRMMAKYERQKHGIE